MTDWYDCLTPNTQIRFWNKVATGGEDECWLWFGGVRGRLDDERGEFGVRHGLMISSHRVAWAIINGRIPDGLHVLHKCDTPLCCNPRHLFLGTHQDNMDDKTTKGRHRGGIPRRYTAQEILEIRSLRPQLTLAKIAKRYNTGYSTIQKIISGETYKDIANPEETTR